MQSEPGQSSSGGDPRRAAAILGVGLLVTIGAFVWLLGPGTPADADRVGSDLERAVIDSCLLTGGEDVEAVCSCAYERIIAAGVDTIEDFEQLDAQAGDGGSVPAVISDAVEACSG